MRPSLARPARRGWIAPHRRNRSRRRAGRSGAVPDFRRRFRPAAAARRSHHARRKTGNHKIVVGLRRQHPRDQRRAQAHLADQRRPTGAPGLSRARAFAAALRRDRRRSGRDWFRPHRAGCFYLRAGPRDSGEVRHLRARARAGSRAHRTRRVRRYCGDTQAGRSHLPERTAYA